MNTFIIGSSSNCYGEYKEKLNIKDNTSFENFLQELVENDAERCCGGMIQTSSCEKIAKTLRCFKIEFREFYKDTLIVNDLSVINTDVFIGEKTNLEVLLWITKEMVEELADKIDENIRYGGFVDNEFLCNVRDFLLNTYIKVEGYELLNNGEKIYKKKYRSDF